jgi:hypothetical protein
MRVAIGAGLALLLAGCGGAGTTTTNTSTSTTTETSSASREPASDAKMSDPRTASGGSNDCARNPGFAPVYAGSTMVVCSSTHFGNTGKDSGSFTYTTDATPAAVLAFGKESAGKSRLKVLIDTPAMLSVAEGDKRRFVMFPRAEGGKTKVTVNWTNTP